MNKQCTSPHGPLIGGSYVLTTRTYESSNEMKNILLDLQNSSTGKMFIKYDISSSESKNTPIICSSRYNYSYAFASGLGIYKQTNIIYMTVWGSHVESYYAIGFVKEDNLSLLSTYGSTISEICSNAYSLFDDVSALNDMVLRCTGDFMISALSNSIFVAAMNASSNKSILTNNTHWKKFIDLLSV